MQFIALGSIVDCVWWPVKSRRKTIASPLSQFQEPAHERGVGAAGQQLLGRSDFESSGVRSLLLRIVSLCKEVPTLIRNFLFRHVERQQHRALLCHKRGFDR
jgi:hypothetical protein